LLADPKSEYQKKEEANSIVGCSGGAGRLCRAHP
jgi:hypothetical protein